MSTLPVPGNGGKWQLPPAPFGRAPPPPPYSPAPFAAAAAAEAAEAAATAATAAVAEAAAAVEAAEAAEAAATAAAAKAAETFETAIPVGAGDSDDASPYAPFAPSAPAAPAAAFEAVAPTAPAAPAAAFETKPQRIGKRQWMPPAPATPAPAVPFNHYAAEIESTRGKMYDVARTMFADIDTTLSSAGAGFSAFSEKEARERVKQVFIRLLCNLNPADRCQVVEDTLWTVLHLSATVAAHHAPEVQARVDTTTAAVLSALAAHKPMMNVSNSHSLLYRCVHDTTHVFGPKTLAMIVSRSDQCFRENELLDTEAMASFERRYHQNVLDGYTAMTCRPAGSHTQV